MPDRVVVTGLGAVTPFGAGVAPFWDGLLGSEVALGPIADGTLTPVEGARGGLVPSGAVEVDDGARCSAFAIAAAREAIEHAGLGSADLGAVWTLLGTVIGTRAGLEYVARGQVNPPSPRGETLAVDVASAVGAGGPAFVIGNACAAGNTAVLEAAELIRSGSADACLAGGAEELTATMITMFRRFRSEAEELPRPFDSRRDGLLLSEGAGVVVLESYEHAIHRGAPVLAEVVGWANTADAHHMTAPHPDGRGARTAMRAALERGGLRRGDCDFVCAHGTATKINDLVEGQAIADLFGDATPAVTSIKGSVGHLQGAASAVEALVCILAIQHGVVPPTPACAHPDPSCMVTPLDTARRGPVRAALNNSFGFGGNVSCVAFAASA